jgi:tRNA G37 N-methylase Trm5
LKTESASKFPEKIEHEVVPLLRKQKGFLDQLTILSDSGEIIYIYTFRKDSEDAEKYDCTALPALTTLLTGVIDGAPHVHAFGLRSLEKGALPGWIERFSTSERCERVLARVCMARVSRIRVFTSSVYHVGA